MAQIYLDNTNEANDWFSQYNGAGTGSYNVNSTNPTSGSQVYIGDLYNGTMSQPSGNTLGYYYDPTKGTPPAGAPTTPATGFNLWQTGGLAGGKSPIGTSTTPTNGFDLSALTNLFNTYNTNMTNLFDKYLGQQQKSNTTSTTGNALGNLYNNRVNWGNYQYGNRGRYFNKDTGNYSGLEQAQTGSI